MHTLLLLFCYKAFPFSFLSSSFTFCDIHLSFYTNLPFLCWIIMMVYTFRRSCHFALTTYSCLFLMKNPILLKYYIRVIDTESSSRLIYWIYLLQIYVLQFSFSAADECKIILLYRCVQQLYDVCFRILNFNMYTKTM